MKHLYIIGNGFDLHHDVNCSFVDYAMWLKSNNLDLYTKIENAYFITNIELWKDFEKLLGSLDTQYHSERIASEHYPDFKRLPDSDRAFDDAKYEYETSPEYAQYEFEELFYEIRISFREWIEQLYRPEKEKMLPIEKLDSYYVSFNYTDTLESLYKIPSEQIIYIHGCVKRKEELVFGHGLEYESIHQRETIEPPADVDTSEKMEEFYMNQTDLVEDETFDEVCRQLSNQRKPVEECMRKLSPIWEQCGDLEIIHVYGFSFSDIDMPYIEELVKHINKLNTTWEISYFTKEDRDYFLRILESLCVPHNKFQLVTLKSLTQSVGVYSLFGRNEVMS